MPNKPYHRIFRPVKDNLPNSGYSSWAYIIEKDYAQNPEHYIRAFSIIQNDLFKLFEYIEPSDDNLKTYSFRIHELLTRICIEIESNFKAILRENIYSKLEKDWNIRDFMLTNQSHHLDEYKAQFPIWKGTKNVFQPFNSFRTKTTPSWWKSYNESKHNRDNNFEKANFENLLSAYSALFILLTSQFFNQELKPGPKYIKEQGYCYYGGGFGIGGYLIPDIPENWKEDELYHFEWDKLEKEQNRFERFNYDSIT